MKRRNPCAFALSLLVFVFARSAHADLDPDCTTLGAALVDHSCFHATQGPYTRVDAVSRSAATSAPPADAVHTYYDVRLPVPVGENLVSYRVASPARAGAWAILHEDGVPIRVETEAGVVLAPLLGHDVATCAFLPKATVFRLAYERYRISLGPSVRDRTFLVIENVDDFLTSNGRDLDGDGYGDPADVVRTMCVPPAGYVQNNTDCDDARADVHPDAPEICDDFDENCNNVVDDVGLPCEAGMGTCARSGVSVCDVSGGPARCDVVPGFPSTESCDGRDDDCDGKSDLDEANLCTERDTPRCVLVLGKTRCGCNDDADCGGETSGRICDLETRVCVAGCVGTDGRNGCTAGTCTSNDPAKPGTCGSACADGCPTGTTCGADGTCAPEPAPDAGAAPDAQAAPVSVDSDGCGCRSVSPRSSGAWPVVPAVALGLLLRRRRARGRST